MSVCVCVCVCARARACICVRVRLSDRMHINLEHWLEHTHAFIQLTYLSEPRLHLQGPRAPLARPLSHPLPHPLKYPLSHTYAHLMPTLVFSELVQSNT